MADERTEKQKVKERTDRKAQLFDADSDKYGIYQLKDNPELRPFRFMGTESLKRMGITKYNFEEIQPENYNLIYTGELSELQKQTQGATLEAIYEKFNIDHPEDFRGHSLSVSDIVVLHQDGAFSSHFVDSFGFTGLPLFTEKLLEEQEIVQDTSGHDVQKSEKVLEDGDEIIDLGDEREQVLAAMKQFLEPEQKSSSVVEDFKAKTNELFHDISELNPSEVEDTVKCHVQAVFHEAGIDATIVDVAVVGSRCRGLEQESSDLDVVVELATNEREDYLFDLLHSEELYIGGVTVDINPITAQRTGTLETYLPTVEEYLEAVRIAREQETAKQVQDTSGHDVNQSAQQNGLKSEQVEKETEVTLVVAECGEFHNYGELYENIPTVEEAISIWKQIPSDRINGIPSIGIHLHRQGEESYKDSEIDLVSGKRIDLDMLEYVPDMKDNPKAVEMIAELIAKLPELSVESTLSEELEHKVSLKRLSDKIPLEQLAVDIDQFAYDYDPHEYRNEIETREEGILSVQYSLASGDTEHLSDWLRNIIDEREPKDDVSKAKELLSRLAEYKPLAKIEEMEEQNYNMIDEVPNNGFEQAKRTEAQQKSGVAEEQKKSVAKVSLKERLAQKKAQIAGQSQSQDTEKKNQREM